MFGRVEGVDPEGVHVMPEVTVSGSVRYGAVGAFPEGSEVSVHRFCGNVHLLTYEVGGINAVSSLVLDPSDADRLAGLLKEAVADADAWRAANR